MSAPGVPVPYMEICSADAGRLHADEAIPGTHLRCGNIDGLETRPVVKLSKCFILDAPDEVNESNPTWVNIQNLFFILNICFAWRFQSN